MNFRLSTWVLLLICMLPGLILVLLVKEHAINVPVYDGWMIGETLQKAVDGSLSISHLLQQENESRVFFPKIILGCMAFFTKWDVRYEMALTFFLGVIISFNLYQLCLYTVSRERRYCLFLMFLANLLVFAPIQWMNWLWGIQFIVFVPVLCLSISMVVSYSTLSVTAKYLLCIFLSCISTFSYANGMLCWVLILPVLLFKTWNIDRRLRGWVILYIAMMAASLIIYFWGYEKPAAHPSFDAALIDPLKTIGFFLAFLGAPLGHALLLDPTGASIAAGCGLIIFLCPVLLYSISNIRDNTLWNRTLPWFAYAGYAFVSAGVTTLGRAGFGLRMAVSSRYTSIAVYLIIALIFLIAICFNGLEKKAGCFRKKIIASISVLIALFLILSLFSSSHAILMMKDRRQEALNARSCVSLINILPKDFLKKYVHPDKELLINLVPFLSQAGLFSIPIVKSKNLSLIKENKLASKQPDGYFDEIVQLDNDEYVAKGWGVLMSRREPPDAVILAYRDENGKQIAFDYAIGPYTARHDVAAYFGVEVLTNCGWNVPFSALSLPKGELEITAWAFDTLKGKAYPLNNAIRINGSDF